MAAIFNEVVISYEGKEYSVKPTFDIINRIEMPATAGGLGISLSGLAARAANGDVAVSEVSKVVALLLNVSGAKVSPEDVYVAIMTAEDPRQYIDVISKAIFPVTKPAKAEEGSKKK